MAKLPLDKDNLPIESWALTQEESVSEAEYVKSSEAIKKHLDESCDEYFLSQSGLLPEWVDG